jgi:hypothetical protein
MEPATLVEKSDFQPPQLSSPWGREWVRNEGVCERLLSDICGDCLGSFTLIRSPVLSGGSTIHIGR